MKLPHTYARLSFDNSIADATILRDKTLMKPSGLLLHILFFVMDILIALLISGIGCISPHVILLELEIGYSDKLNIVLDFVKRSTFTLVIYGARMVYHHLFRLIRSHRVKPD